MHLDWVKRGKTTRLNPSLGQYCFSDCCLTSCTKKATYKFRFFKMGGSPSKETDIVKAENFQESRLEVNEHPELPCWLGGGGRNLCVGHPAPRVSGVWGHPLQGLCQEVKEARDYQPGDNQAIMPCLSERQDLAPAGGEEHVD